jgi:hypothetical protein
MPDRPNVPFVISGQYGSLAWRPDDYDHHW